MKRIIKRILPIALIVVLLIFGYIFVIKKPSNTRDWEFGMEVLPSFTISDSSVSIKNIRDNEFVKDTEFKKNYFDEVYDLNSISTVWFVVSKFSGFGGVAHTYFVFDMTNSEPITVSVEARREKGEKYSLTGGLFNNFELMYVWGSERDSIVRRSLVNKDQVYMYPLTLPDGAAQKLFLQLATRSQSLHATPRFYNTLFSNCTNELAKTANDIKTGTIPWNISLYLPGYSAEELHKLGYIAGSKTIEELEKKHYITTFVQEHYADPQLTSLLRNYLR